MMGGERVSVSVENRQRRPPTLTKVWSYDSGSQGRGHRSSGGIASSVEQENFNGMPGCICVCVCVFFNSAISFFTIRIPLSPSLFPLLLIHQSRRFVSSCSQYVAPSLSVVLTHTHARTHIVYRHPNLQ